MGRRTAALLAPLIALGVAAGVSADPGPVNEFARRLLAQQNAERARVGVPRLEWSSKLAREAQGWAEKLARSGSLEHASNTVRGNAGENLWMGAAGYYSAEVMIDSFVNEKRLYRPGAFPQVSTTGNWEDVGHYTQIVWRDTKQVGCAVARGSQNDFLVCRYWPAGNWMGQRAF